MSEETKVPFSQAIGTKIMLCSTDNLMELTAPIHVGDVVSLLGCCIRITEASRAGSLVQTNYNVTLIQSWANKPLWLLICRLLMQ